MEPDHFRYVGEHAHPFLGVVAAAVYSKREQIFTAVVAGLITGAMTAGAMYAFAINDLKSDMRYEKERRVMLEAEIHINRDGIGRNADKISQNLLELVRQAGTDQLTLQQLKQINSKIDGLIKDQREDTYGGNG